MKHFIEIPMVGSGTLTDEFTSIKNKTVFVRDDGKIYNADEIVGRFDVTTKDMAKSSSQCTGSALECWSDEIVEAVRNW